MLAITFVNIMIFGLGLGLCLSNRHTTFLLTPYFISLNIRMDFNIVSLQIHHLIFQQMSHNPPSLLSPIFPPALSSLSQSPFSPLNCQLFHSPFSPLNCPLFHSPFSPLKCPLFHSPFSPLNCQLFHSTLSPLNCPMFHSPFSPLNSPLFHSHSNITQILISSILIFSPFHFTLQFIYLCSTMRYSCDVLCNVHIGSLNVVILWCRLSCHFIRCHKTH